MSAKALKALMGTVAGLVILWLAVSYFPRGDRGPGGPSDTLATFFDGVTPEAVSALRFRDPDDGSQVELIRVGGEWKVNGFRADSANLDRFWDALGNAEIGDLVAANPANHPRMGLASDSAWVMEVELASGPRSLLIGNPGPQYGTAFVRLPGEDQVHPGRARERCLDEALVAGDVDDTERHPARKVEPREPELDRYPAFLLLAEPVGVDARQRLDELGLSMIDVTCGAEDDVFGRFGHGEPPAGHGTSGNRLVGKDTT